MIQLLFIASLFLPILWRTLVAFTVKSRCNPIVDVSLLMIPLIVVAFPLCVFGFSMGAYGLFIPLMIATFWVPQLAFIAFFAVCEREDAKRTSDETTKAHITNNRTI